MKGKNKKKQIVKISVFITSIFVIFMSVTYAFISQVLMGTKQVVVNAGVLDLVLEEENEITISDALPMYDEVGMIQEPFTFRLVNNGNNEVNYKLKLVDVTPQTVERKCSDYGEITLDSPVGCRETIYPDELRQEALMMCQDIYPISSESECASAVQMDGAPFNTFEGFIDFFIAEGVFEDTRTLVNTYPDRVIEVNVEELFWEDIRYGLTKNGENTIGYIEDMENQLRLEDPMVREKVLNTCISRFQGVTDEASCLAILKDNGASYNTFEELILDSYWFNGGSEFVLDVGTINANETINYDLRLWISEYVEYIEDIEGKTFSFKIDVEVEQEIEKNDYPITTKLFSEDSIGANCKLYDDGVETFLVGECKKNYVWYSGKLWRVISKNNETGAVKMVTDNNITTISFNEENNSSIENSYVDQWLNQEFLPTLHDAQYYLVIDSVWDVSSNIDSTVDSLKRPLYESTITRTVGLINTYEYNVTRAKFSEEVLSKTAYLNNGTEWWLMTPYISSDIYGVDFRGELSWFSNYAGYGIRPSVNLKPSVRIFDGIGIKSSPYILEGDIIKPENGITLLNTRYSGEYITFNDQLYRIVDIENGLTKITAVNVLNSFYEHKFHTEKSQNNFENASIKTDLENYYQEIKITNEKSFNMIEPNTEWYLGSLGKTHTYKATICAKVDANISMNACTSKAASTTTSIGLPRIGEMFTSQITRDEEVSFWTLTPSTTGFVKYISNASQLGSDRTNYVYGVRPSMYLKQNVVIASDNTGNGTYEHPYSIELGQ